MSGAFNKLARPIQKWVREQGWRELRDIQARAVYEIVDSDADLILAASTAGGKTEAAFLPLISQVLQAPAERGGFDLLYIGPLKALITDQAERLEDICRGVDLPIFPWHGDVAASVKTRALKAPRGLLLITPESLEALFIRRGIEIPRLFNSTQAVVIDELHSVLDSERGVHLRSLLTRMELALRRPLRRIGLSATLGDMALAKAYLRPDAAESVRLIEASGGGAELQLQLRGYVAGQDNENEPSAADAIASHLFDYLRGSDNLVFAGARQSVEIYADKLRTLSESAHLPEEFFPHHASLSREHRDFVERRLKDGGKPTTAICTSTLELGIDIGDVSCVAQVGAPFSVASLRQRLGRSGRREGQPAILRQYVVEAQLAARSNIVDQLRLGLVRAIAMIELLLEGWCEPPKPDALHLSTLVHQTLSVIASQGGAHANDLHRMLCRQGPFRQVGVELYADLLRAMGHPESGLIEQSSSGLLLLGALGEKLVEHYSFYAVFRTSEEYRLIANGRELGTVPIDNILTPGMMIIFSGRRWTVEEIHDRDRVILVAPAEAGVPPKFDGDPGDIHDRVVEKMFSIFESEETPIYLDRTARSLLDEARDSYAHLGFEIGSIVRNEGGAWVLATRCGTVKNATLALALRSFGFYVQQYDGVLEVTGKTEAMSLEAALASIAEGGDLNLFANRSNLIFEKFHPYLPAELLQLDALSSRLDKASLPDVCVRLLSPH